MNVQELINLVREYVDEPSEDASDWSDSNILSYINMENRHLFSLTRGSHQDWFGRESIFSTSNNQTRYFLPDNMIAVRRVELIGSEAISGEAPFFQVDESRARIQEIPQLNLNQKENSYPLRTTTQFQMVDGYYLWGEEIRFGSGAKLGNHHIRIFYAPQAPNLHLSRVQAADNDSITLGLNNEALTLGRVSPEDHYYDGMKIEIIEGSGAGQVRRIVTYYGDEQRATIDRPWRQAIDQSSVYSIVSPIQEDFQELMALGAAIRAKGLKTEDSIAEVAQVYGALLEQFKRSLELRNQQSSRRILSTNGSELWN